MISTTTSQRKMCLTEAQKIVCTDRNKQYGEPEDNFLVIADYWTIYLDNRYKASMPLTAEDVANMMILFKMGRITTSRSFKADSYVDVSGYAACACECAQKENEIDLAKKINLTDSGKC